MIVAILIATQAATAAEPDGLASFRYEWIGERAAPGECRRLRLSVTASVPLEDALIEASSPSGIATVVRRVQRPPGGPDVPWPAEGLLLGRLASGAPVVIDVELIEPPKGGEIVAFSLRALRDGRAVREGVGVPIGTPGLAPVLRNGAAEFPAGRDGPRP